MEALLQRLIQLSSNLVERLDNADLEQIDNYMQQREELFRELEQLVVPAEQMAVLRQEADRLISIESVIVARMVTLRDEAKQQWEKIQQGRRSQARYDSAYGGGDSLFFDARR
ncbi:hypothetical protein [Paenibacillus glycanilyticus]|uniref:Flagellar protein FliT n=1 Tax=Paenibacillus glycanilyticus TaxID=126569 RepID=A0ABQ6GIW8_9BACL|nr:hypothetical protein [Paenibacillus glycanilyticus]GLX70894.1 hypothetical protein MU1_52420 [Paenibacillus glycanilyticus]